MKIRLSRVAKGALPWADSAAADYTRRIQRYGPFEEVLLRPEGDPRAESERLLKMLQPRDRLLVLDERGEALGSEGWAQELQSARINGVPSLWFAIGGPDGHAPLLRERGARILSLSPLVLAHQVARVVALEQIYRAWTILNNEPYHRGG